MPFMVLLAAPFALFDALLALWLRGIEHDVYGEIGLVVLIGVSAKNAILIDLCSASGRAGLLGRRIGQSRAHGSADRRRRARAARTPLIGHR